MKYPILFNCLCIGTNLTTLCNLYKFFLDDFTSISKKFCLYLFFACQKDKILLHKTKAHLQEVKSLIGVFVIILFSSSGNVTFI